jgi:hypothetical protein
MTSPFPGMDPFLENPLHWPDVHHGLISEIQAYLNFKIRPKYHVRVEERIYISDENDPGRKTRVPDLRIVTRPDSAGRPSVNGGNAGVGIVEPLVVTTLFEEEIHEAYLEIRDTENRRVVTVIEVVSPTNKLAGSQGRASFEQKRREIINSSSHWVEIDLLRGSHPLPTKELVPPSDYRVFVSRRETRPEGRVWQIPVTERLPEVRLPLQPEDPDATLDLQPVLDAAYVRGAYDLIVNYGTDPVPPLEGDVAAWADDLLKKTGLR